MTDMFDEEQVTPGGTWTVPLGWTADNEGVCRSCRAEVLWCVTPAGKKSPINRDGTSLAVEREDLSAHDIEHDLAEQRRQDEWAKKNGADRRRTAEDRKAHAVTALEAKDVPQDARIVVSGGWGGSDETCKRIVAHLAKAGYGSVEARSGYTGERVKGQCDDGCAVWLLSIDTWSPSVRLSQACTVQAHYDAKWKASQAKDNAARNERARVHEVVRARLVELLADVDPNALRAVLWVGLDWSLNDWVKEHKGERKKPDAWGALTDLEGTALVEEAAKYLTKAFDDRHNVKLDWPAIEAAFGVARDGDSA